jgi:hypothetical protein
MSNYLLLKNGEPIFLGTETQTKKEYRRHLIAGSRVILCSVKIGNRGFGLIRPLTDSEISYFLHKQQPQEQTSQQNLFKEAL